MTQLSPETASSAALHFSRRTLITPFDPPTTRVQAAPCPLALERGQRVALARLDALVEERAAPLAAAARPGGGAILVARLFGWVHEQQPDLQRNRPANTHGRQDGASLAPRSAGLPPPGHRVAAAAGLASHVQAQATVCHPWRRHPRVRAEQLAQGAAVRAYDAVRRLGGVRVRVRVGAAVGSAKEMPPITCSVISTSALTLRAEAPASPQSG